MAQPDRQESPDIKRSEQGVLNNSFDEVYKVLVFLPLVENNSATYRLQGDAHGNVRTTAPTLKTLIDKTTTTNVIYIGKAPIGTATSSASWLISKVDKSGSPISITYAAAGASTATWNNRATTETYT